MDVNMSEQDQLNAIKDWWKKYGNYIVAGLVIALVANIGWNLYQRRRHIHSEYASMMYTKLLASYVQNDTSAVQTQADYLVKNFRNVPYASLASFVLVKQLVNDGKYDTALTKLDEVIRHEHTSQLKQIARIRKARILLEQDKIQNALEALNTIDEKSFMPLINEVRGDIYVAKGEPQKARQEYQAALQELPVGEVNRNLLQMKFDQLAIPENGIV